jgi:hypothetical protein
VLADRAAHEEAHLRRQGLREHQRLAELRRLLAHEGPRAVEVRPHVGREEPDQEPEDDRKRRERDRRDRLERGLVSAAHGHLHRREAGEGHEVAEAQGHAAPILSSLLDGWCGKRIEQVSRMI